MQLAGTVDLPDCLAFLAAQRPVFHSEADFQQALAWQIHTTVPGLRVRLERRTRRGEHLDLWVEDPTSGLSTALELKYLCAGLTCEHSGERFDLPNQGAQDIRGYDVLKDVVRIEQTVDRGDATTGAVVVLANDPGYWRRPGHGRVTGAAAFRLYEGETVTGVRAWGEQSAATSMHRPHPLELRGTYTLRWAEYSQMAERRNGTFRVLVIEVPGH